MSSDYDGEAYFIAQIDEEVKPNLLIDTLIKLGCTLKVFKNRAEYFYEYFEDKSGTRNVVNEENMKLFKNGSLRLILGGSGLNYIDEKYILYSHNHYELSFSKDKDNVIDFIYIGIVDSLSCGKLLILNIPHNIDSRKTLKNILPDNGLDEFLYNWLYMCILIINTMDVNKLITENTFIDEYWKLGVFLPLNNANTFEIKSKDFSLPLLYYNKFWTFQDYIDAGFLDNMGELEVNIFFAISKINPLFNIPRKYVKDVNSMLNTNVAKIFEK